MRPLGCAGQALRRRGDPEGDSPDFFMDYPAGSWPRAGWHTPGDTPQAELAWLLEAKQRHQLCWEMAFLAQSQGTSLAELPGIQLGLQKDIPSQESLLSRVSVETQKHSPNQDSES